MRHDCAQEVRNLRPKLHLVSQKPRYVNHSVCSACYLRHTDFLLGVFFDPEDGGDMFLHNVG
jgi:hypothetical protein